MKLVVTGSAKCEVHGRCGKKAKRNKDPGVTAIGNSSHKKLADTIGNSTDTNYVTDHFLGITKVNLHVFADDGDIVSYEIIECVADEGGLKNTPTEFRILALYF